MPEKRTSSRPADPAGDAATRPTPRTNLNHPRLQLTFEQLGVSPLPFLEPDPLLDDCPHEAGHRPPRSLPKS